MARSILSLGMFSTRARDDGGAQARIHHRSGVRLGRHVISRANLPKSFDSGHPAGPCDA